MWLYSGMELKPIQVMLPAHSHLALRVFALTNSKTVTKVVLEALDQVYPSLQVLEDKPRPVTLNPIRR